jgi:hypothetical protein
MPIFYILHSVAKAPAENELQGPRNARIFLLGAFIYVCLYIFLKNMVINKRITQVEYGPIIVGFIVLLFADIFAMGYVYKSYFGRSITAEAGEIICSVPHDKYNYDEKNHKYTYNNTKLENEIKPKLENTKPNNFLIDVLDKTITKGQTSTIKKYNDNELKDKTKNDDKTISSNHKSSTSDKKKNDKSVSSSNTNDKKKNDKLVDSNHTSDKKNDESVNLNSSSDKKKNDKINIKKNTKKNTKKNSKKKTSTVNSR